MIPDVFGHQREEETNTSFALSWLLDDPVER